MSDQPLLQFSDAVRGLRIGVVEDQEMIRRTMTALLSRAGATVDSWGETSTAFEELNRRGVDIDLLVTDVVMDGGSGPDLAQRLRELKQDLPVVFISGYSVQVLPADWAADPYSGFVGKPFVAAELFALIERLVATGS